MPHSKRKGKIIDADVAEHIYAARYITDLGCVVIFNFIALAHICKVLELSCPPSSDTPLIPPIFFPDFPCTSSLATKWGYLLPRYPRLIAAYFHLPVWEVYAVVCFVGVIPLWLLCVVFYKRMYTDPTRWTRLCFVFGGRVLPKLLSMLPAVWIVCVRPAGVNPSYLPTYLDIYLPNEWFLITWQAVAIQLPWRRQALVTVPDCMCTMLLHALVALHRPDQHVSSVRGACLSLLSCGTAILVSRYMEQQACHKLAASRQCATAASAAAADRTAAAGPGPGTAAGTASVDGAQGAGGSSSRVCQSGQQLSSIRQRHKVQAAGAAGSQSAAPGSASATHAGQQAVAAAAPTSVPEHVWEDVTLSTQGLAGGPVPAHPELSPVVAAGCGVSIKLAGSGSILRGARQPGSGSSVGASGCVDVVGGGSGHVGSRCTTSTDSSGPMPPAVASAGDEAVAPAVAPRGDRAVAAAAPEHGDGTVAVTITSAVARREPAAVAQGRAAAELTQQICQLVVQRRQYKSQLQRFRLHCSLSGVTAPPSGLSAEALALRLQSLIREAGPPGLMVISATWSTTGQTSPTPDT